MHSIRFKTTVLTVVAMLVTVASLFLVSFSILQAENDRRSVELMNLVAADTRKSLEKYTEDIEQAVETASHLAGDTLDSMELVAGGIVGTAVDKSERTPEQVARIDDYMNEYVSKLQVDMATVASHTRGIVTYYYCINPEVSTTEHGFFYSRVGKTGFAEREPLDARELDPNDLEHTAWYYTPISRGRPSWVGPYVASFLDEMVICSYLVPIYKAGTLIGVMGMDIPLDTLTTLVSSIRVYDSGFACLLDSEGQVLYHPQLDKGAVPESLLSEQALMRVDSGDALIRYVSGGEERQMSFTTLSNGMKLVIVAPLAEVNAASAKLVRVIVPVAVGTIVFFAVLALVAMRHLMRPLQLLTDASRRLANADYNVELSYKGHDEVGALTAAFQRMRDQIKAYIADLNRRIHTDDLTGLPNQRYFFELAEQERQRMQAAGEKPAVLYFNLVGMKHFNRQYGFDEGDTLMRSVAQLLASHFGSQRTGRFGQDHFAVVASEDRLEKRLYEVLSECQRLNDGKTLPVSVGIYQDSLENVPVSVACDRAKYACDQRRGSYLSGYCYFDIHMLNQEELSRYVRDHVDQALEEGWIQVFYQPIVRAVNGKVCDEEALSRWIDPHKGFLSPADFVPALEDAGLIYRLDLYVLDRVLEKIRAQEQAGLCPVSHSINLSRSDFDSCDIVEEIRERVDAAGIDRARISIEITESIVGSDFAFMKGQMERFRSLGFPVWMDDFGSGYSSLDLLQSLSFDLIKFDMSFLRKLDEGNNGKIILTELMQMATGLGVDTICEGVETEEQKRFLQDIGCSKLQGYYYCKPIPLDEIFLRYEQGIEIGYENPEESAYFAAIGKANLLDLRAITLDDEQSLHGAFNTIPMGIIELKGNVAAFVRTNQSCRDFLTRYFGGDLVKAQAFFAPHAVACSEQGSMVFFDERLPEGSLAHLLARRVGSNGVTGATAVEVAVLSIGDADEGATYANIARALAVDYYNIYYVDLDTEKFIEYRSPVGEEGLALERHGEDFFAASKRDTMTRIYEDDRDAFLAVFTKEHVIQELDERGVFTASYRLIDTGAPMRVNMKITRMGPESRQIIIGISIEDA